MGDAMSTCCNHAGNTDHLPREIITLDEAEWYYSMKKDFMKQYPRIKQIMTHKWSYATKVDKQTIAIGNDCTVVGRTNSDKPSEVIVFYKEGYMYEGGMVNGVREGCGRLVSGDGDCYEGQWKGNYPEGQGVFQGSNPKRKYRGHWIKGELQGKGKASYEDGSQYEGDFTRNLRHGKGKIVYKCGSTYQGDFRNDAIEGFGTMIGSNHKYEGSWRGGLMDGAGKSSWYDDADQLSETYEGEYREGLKHGRGEYRWSNGRVVKGEWERGVLRSDRR